MKNTELNQDNAMMPRLFQKALFNKDLDNVNYMQVKIALSATI